MSKKHFPCLFVLLILLLFYLTVSCSLKGKDEESSVFEPEASLEKASDLIRTGYYEDARSVLEDVRAKDASQKYGILAKLRIADSYFEEMLYDEAAAEYESFLGIHQQHKYASYAQYKLAMCFFKKIKSPDVSYSIAKKALYEFEKLQRNYPRNPYMDITENRIRKCKRILAEHEFYVGEFYLKKGSYGAAVKRFRDMVKLYPDSGKVSEALYYLGVAYKNLGQRDNAIDALSTLIENFPATEISEEAKKLLASVQQNQ